MVIRNNKISIVVTFSLLLLMSMFAVCAATDSLGTFKQNNCVNLLQLCSNCTFNNITFIFYPNSTNALSIEQEMTKNNTLYNYTFCNTKDIGTYLVNGYGDLNGLNTVWNYDFEITKSGSTELNESSAMPTILFVIFLSIICFIIPYIIQFSKNEVINMIVKRSLFVIGIYTLIMNIGIIKTIALSNNLDIQADLNAYIMIFGWIGYIAIVVIALQTLFNAIQIRKQRKYNKRMGFT